MTITKQGWDEFEDKAKACVFMGYPFRKKGYRAMELETSKFYESRGVVFHENIFPFTVSTKNWIHCPILNLVQTTNAVDDEVDQLIIHGIDVLFVRPAIAEVAQPLRRSTR